MLSLLLELLLEDDKKPIWELLDNCIVQLYNAEDQRVHIKWTQVDSGNIGGTCDDYYWDGFEHTNEFEHLLIKNNKLFHTTNKPYARDGYSIAGEDVKNVDINLQQKTMHIYVEFTLTIGTMKYNSSNGMYMRIIQYSDYLLDKNNSIIQNDHTSIDHTSNMDDNENMYTVYLYFIIILLVIGISMYFFRKYRSQPVMHVMH